MRKKSRIQIACLLVLAAFSAFIAIRMFPYGFGRLGLAFTILSLASLFLRVGWFVPFTIAGTYAGIMMDARVKGGSIESQMWETVTSIVFGAVIGFAFGGFLDLLAVKSDSESNEDSRLAD